MRTKTKRSYTRETKEPKRTPVTKIVDYIKFNASEFGFEAGEKFEFRPGLNLLVGDQGCGKSTLIGCLMEKHRDLTELKLVDGHEGADFLSFDTERDNPRIKGSIEGERNPMHILSSRFKSHGETILPMVEMVKDAVGYVIFLDEPESGLSIRSQIKVSKAIKKAGKSCQLFVATHCPYIIKMADEVLDLERRKWTTPEEFIKYQEDVKK